MIKFFILNKDNSLRVEYMQAISTLKEFCMKRILSVLAIKIYEDGVENGSSLTHKGW